MSKIKLATVWLDGCSGCHMSLLDIDEALAVVARKADIVYGPLVDAQEFPEGVDVTLVEGAISNQDDLKKIQTIRRRSRMIVSLGDCAVTGNVPAMRNTILLAAVSGVYYWRAKTEEKHLLADPAYAAYWNWAQTNALVPRLCARVTGRQRPLIRLDPDERVGPVA